MPFGGPCRSACTMVESSRTCNNWRRRSSGVARTVTEFHWWQYQPVEASPAGCRTGELWTYWTQVQLAVDICTLALLYVADVIRDELFAGVQHIIFLKLYVSGSQSCWSYVAPSNVLSVYYDKICIKFASHHLLMYVHRDPKNWPPNTLSFNAIISQYSSNKFYEMFEEVKDCKQ